MRLLLNFISLCFIAIPANAKCWNVKCASGFILRNNGAVFDKEGSQGLVNSRSDRGCILILNENCDVESGNGDGYYPVPAYGECKKQTIYESLLMSQYKGVCTQMEEDIDFLQPHYTVSVLDALIKETAFLHCRSILHQKFVEMEGSRESCTPEKTIIIILGTCGAVGGLIFIGGIIALACWVERRKRNRRNREEKSEEMLRMKRQQDAYDIAVNPMNNYANPNAGPMNPGMGPPMMNPGVGPAMNPHMGQTNAPYMDPRMNSGMPMDPMLVDPNAPPM